MKILKSQSKLRADKATTRTQIGNYVQQLREFLKHGDLKKIRVDQLKQMRSELDRGIFFLNKQTVKKYVIVLEFATCCITTDNDIVTSVDGMCAWMIGRHMSDVVKWAEKKNAGINQIN